MFERKFSRQRFLVGAGASGLLTRLGWMNSLATAAPNPSPGYRALVCIFLAGGNDGHNTIIPQSQSAYNTYKTGIGGLSLPDSNGAVVPIQAKDGAPYALNPGLSAFQPLWTQGKLAVLANVGMLVQPITRAQYLNNQAPVPTNLFSHSDQVQQMQSGIPSSAAGSGWGGRTADQLQSLNATSNFPTNFSIAGPALFTSGNVVQAAALLPGFNLDVSGMSLWPQAAAAGRTNGLQQIIQMNSGLSLVQSANQARQGAMELNALLTSSSATLQTQFPGTTLGTQLQQVASIINLRGSTGMTRQVFFCSLGGFDTHGGQSWQQYDLLRQVSQAMTAFYQSTIEMGVSDSVTSFTLSDFGRTLQPSGTGTDHGWGSHHFILGDAVQGGNLYGTFPDLTLGGPDDSGSRGALIPSTSTEQYGATLAAWLGVPAANMSSVFSNIGNFTTQNLGFLG